MWVHPEPSGRAQCAKQLHNSLAKQALDPFGKTAASSSTRAQGPNYEGVCSKSVPHGLHDGVPQRTRERQHIKVLFQCAVTPPEPNAGNEEQRRLRLSLTYTSAHRPTVSGCVLNRA